MIINQSQLNQNQFNQFNQNQLNQTNQSFYKPIYSTNQELKNTQKYQNKSNKIFKNSFNPDTKIINNIYNQMNTSDYPVNLNSNYSPFISSYNKKNNIEFFNNSQPNLLNDTNNFKQFMNKSINQINPLNYDEIHNSQNNLSMLDNQFDSLKFNNPSVPAALNRTPQNINNKSYLEDVSNSQNNFSNFDNSMMIYDINRQNILEDDPTTVNPDLIAKRMVHNNMVPNFSQKSLGESVDNYEQYGNIITRKMNEFTGSLNNENYRPKTERRPLFNPMVGLTNIYGSPVKTQEYEGRYIPSKERNNEKPFEPVRVQPGLNLPYNGESNVGFHDPYRILPKTIDELRTLDNPQTSYTPPVKWGLISDEVAARPNVAVHKPPTFVENERIHKSDTDKYVENVVKQCLSPGARERLPTKAYYDKEKLRDHYEIENIASNNRGIKATDYTGPLKSDVSKESVIGDVQVSRQNFLQHGPSNVRDFTKSYAINYKNLTPDPTKRNMYNQEQSGFIGTKENNKSYILNKLGLTPDPTKRNMYNQEQSGFIGTNELNKGYVIDKLGLTPDPTKRNMHNQEQSGFIGTNEMNKGYVIDKLGLTPDPTKRNMHNQEQSGFIGTNEMNKGYVIDKLGLTPDPTKRNMHNQEQSGFIGTNEMNKGYVIDKLGLTPDPTKRNMHNQEQSGFIGTNEMNKGYVMDRIGLTPDPTKRNMHNQEQSGFIGTNEMNKGYVIDKLGLTPDPTKRNMHNQEQSGFIGTSENNKGYILNRLGLTPDPTKRNMHNQEQSGFIGTRENNKGYTLNRLGLTPDPTKRNMHNQEQSGFIGTRENNKGYILNRLGLTPEPTKRNMHNYNDHNGAAPISIIKPRSRLDANNMYTNQSKDNLTIIKHSPTPVKYFKTPSNDFSELRMCKKIQINRDLYPDITQQLTIGTEPLYNDVSINQGYTRPKQLLKSLEDRFYSFANENLQGNPYINNTQDKSIGVLNNDFAPFANTEGKNLANINSEKIN